jgi:hypothetical protein
MTPSFRSPLSLGRRRFEITDEEPLGPPARDSLEASDDRQPQAEDFDLDAYSDERAPSGTSAPDPTEEAGRLPARASSAGRATLLSAAALALAGLALVSAFHGQRLERPPGGKAPIRARRHPAPHVTAGRSSASGGRQPQKGRRASAHRQSSPPRRTRPTRAAWIAAPPRGDEPAARAAPAAPASATRAAAPSARPAVAASAAPTPRQIAPVPSKPAEPAPKGSGSPSSAASSPGDPEFGFPP